MKRLARYGLLAALCVASAAVATATAYDASRAMRVGTASGCTPRWHVVSFSTSLRTKLNAVAAISPSDAWAVGSVIEHWDGTSWQLTPSPGELTDVVALSRTNIWAVGPGSKRLGPLIEHWNGRQWQTVPAPKVAYGLQSISAVSPRSIWAVGGQDNRAIERQEGLHWNGQVWEPVRTGDELVSVAAVSDTDVWAGGYGDAAPDMRHWNGKKWSPFPKPDTLDDYGNDETYVSGVAALSTHKAWAVGSFDSGDTVHDGFIGSWNGKRWKLMRSVYKVLVDVAALSPQDVWAVGYVTNSDDDYRGALIRHWDGVRWSTLPAPRGGPSAWLSGVAGTSSRDVWAVGPTGPPWGGAASHGALIEHYGCTY